jgi:hypothetical protein
MISYRPSWPEEYEKAARKDFNWRHTDLPLRVQHVIYVRGFDSKKIVCMNSFGKEHEKELITLDDLCDANGTQKNKWKFSNIKILKIQNSESKEVIFTGSLKD